MDNYERAFYRKDKLLDEAAEIIKDRSRFVLFAIDEDCETLNSVLFHRLSSQEKLDIRCDVKAVKDFIRSESYAELKNIFAKEGETNV